MARLFVVVLLLASLLVPPFAGSAFSGAARAAMVSAAADQDGGAPAAPSRQDKVIHAGTHCACQVADRLDPPRHTLPTAFSAVAHPLRSAQALPSRETEPPARPPRA